VLASEAIGMKANGQYRQHKTSASPYSRSFGRVRVSP
jgi:hypothetical protein